MGQEQQQNPHHPDLNLSNPNPLGLVVGNYCHDVLFREGHVIGRSLGGASSFISNVLDSSLPSPPFLYISKVGPDFAYSLPHPPITSPSSLTTLFHAHFDRSTRSLTRVRTCDPISPSDLPSSTSSSPPLFQFGIAAAVAGEIPPETLEALISLCRTVLVDVQGLIRVFDSADGAVDHVPLSSTAFFPLLHRIAFLKASAEEAPFVDVEEARKLCCVIVTDGKDGCRVYWKDGDVRIPPFPAVQVDPTGAGDSFLGGFVAGLASGLTVTDAALLGNFFGSITVGQIGVPKFDQSMLQTVKQELERKTIGSCWRNIGADLLVSGTHKEFHAFLIEAAKLSCSDLSTEQRVERDSSAEQGEDKDEHHI